MRDHLTIMAVGVERILPVRAAVLRPGRAYDAARFTGDDAATTLHLAALATEDRVIGCLSLMLAEWNGEPARRLRGMAVLPPWQRRGIGRALIDELHARVRAGPPPYLVWCHARIEAVTFYQKLGYRLVSDAFDVPGIGPHYVMSIREDPDQA